MTPAVLGKPFGLRLPLELKEWIENRSIRNYRSMNGEIVAILSAIRDDENKGGDLVTIANPSGVAGDKPLFPV